MPGEFELLSIPAQGTAVEYDEEFISPETPIIPYAPGTDDALVSATRRILTAAADRMGREISWLRVYAGPDAQDRYGTALPRDTISALRKFRLGLLGPLATNQSVARTRTRELHRQVGLSGVLNHCATLPGRALSTQRHRRTELTLFRDATEDAAAALEYAPDTTGASGLRDYLQDTTSNRVPEAPVGFNIRPISAAATESLVKQAIEYAFDRDRDVLTIVHQGDLLPASEGSFLTWARQYLAAEYGDATITESRFNTEFDGEYPEDDVVVTARQTDHVCRDLISAPDQYDVLVAPALAGQYIAAIAGERAGGLELMPHLHLGDGRILATAGPPRNESRRRTDRTLIGFIRAGSLLFEYIGWTDAASTVQSTLSATLDDGIMPQGFREDGRRVPVSTTKFADAIIAHLTNPDRSRSIEDVWITANERLAIKQLIAGVYNIVFDDHLAPQAIELNHLLNEDEEAEIYLPEVGLNIGYWRRWSVERRLEVILHELAHIEEQPGESDHGAAFYDRFVELTELAADWQPELEALFNESIDFPQVQRFIVESVHEETIDPAAETVETRQILLRDRFDLDEAAHY